MQRTKGDIHPYDLSDPSDAPDASDPYGPYDPYDPCDPSCSSRRRADAPVHVASSKVAADKEARLPYMKEGVGYGLAGRGFPKALHAEKEARLPYIGDERFHVENEEMGCALSGRGLAFLPVGEKLASSGFIQPPS